jgi:hypothetical protein
MTDQPLPPRICRYGHRVALDDGSGRIAHGSRDQKPYLECQTCAAVRRADLARLGLK